MHAYDQIPDEMIELLAKRDAATRDGHSSFVTFYTEQLAELGMPSLPVSVEQVEQSNPLQVINEIVAHSAQAQLSEQSDDTWLVEFERLQDVAVKESERDLDVLSTMVADLERVTDFIAQSRVRRAQRERLQAELLAHARKRAG